MPSLLFISLMNGAAWGGSEELWFRAALFAAKKGCQVSCVLFHWKEKEDKAYILKNAGIKILWIPNKGRKKQGIVEKLQYKFSKIAAGRFLKNLPYAHFDHVIFNQGGFEITNIRLYKSSSQIKSYSLLFHNYNESQHFSSSKNKRLKNWLMNARSNLFASGKIVNMLEKNLNIQIPNSSILFNPISFDMPFGPAPYPGPVNGNYIFIMLAALESWRKAQDQLIIAFSSAKWKERNWELHLYGEGRDKEMLEELILKNQLQDKVFLKGHTDDVEQVLLHAHVVLQATHMDAMPIAVVEALSMARPVLISNIGDMPQWLNGNGWICENAFAGAIEKQLENAWQEKEKWEMMGKRSYALFKNKFPPSVEADLLRKMNITL